MAGHGKRKREAPGDSAPGASKQRKHYYNPSNAAVPLHSRGFLISCTGGRERQAAQEAIALLSEYVAEDTRTEHAPQPESGAQDFSKLIQEEVQGLKSQRDKVFEWHKTNINGLLYLSLTKQADSVDPVALVTKIATDVKQSKQCKSRNCLRFLPIQAVCNAKLEDIKAAAAKLCKNAFPSEDEAIPFAVSYEHRASVSLKRGEVIDAVVNGVPQPPHKVNLDNPDKTIIVQLIKSTCAMSVVGQYKQLGKFNLRELSLKDEEAGKNAEEDDSKDAGKQQTVKADAAADAVAKPEEPAEKDAADAEDKQVVVQAD